MFVLYFGNTRYGNNCGRATKQMGSTVGPGTRPEPHGGVPWRRRFALPPAYHSVGTRQRKMLEVRQLLLLYTARGRGNIYPLMSWPPDHCSSHRMICTSSTARVAHVYTKSTVGGAPPLSIPAAHQAIRWRRRI